MLPILMMIFVLMQQQPFVSSLEDASFQPSSNKSVASDGTLKQPSSHYHEHMQNGDSGSRVFVNDGDEHNHTKQDLVKSLVVEPDSFELRGRGGHYSEPEDTDVEPEYHEPSSHIIKVRSGESLDSVSETDQPGHGTLVGSDKNLEESPFGSLEEFPVGMVQRCAQSSDCQLKGAVCAYGNCTCRNSDRVAWHDGRMTCERIHCTTDEQCNEAKLSHSKLLKIVMYKCAKANGTCVCYDEQPDKYDVSCKDRWIYLLGISMATFAALCVCTCFLVPICVFSMCIGCCWTFMVGCNDDARGRGHATTSSSKAI